jgi:hypothetical protein
MTLTPRQLDVLRLLRRYFYLRTSQIRDRVIPHDGDGTMTRGVLRKLQAAELIRRYQPKMIDPLSGSTAPIFVLTIKGSAVLATETSDCSNLLIVQPNFSDWLSLNHYCALGGIHMAIDDALAAQTSAKMTALYFEHEVVQPDADDPAKRFHLYTVTCPAPRVVVCPDTAFEIEFSGHRRAWYVEREMGSDTPARVAAKKFKGYAGLAATGFYRRHFPEARDFRVLAFCPNANWRDALRREMKQKEGAELWLFCSSLDVTASSFLSQEILFTADKGPFAFLPRTPAASPGAEKQADRPTVVIKR